MKKRSYFLLSFAGTLFGDAGSATLISTDGFAEIGNFSLGTDGKGAKNLIVKTGGCIS